MKQQILVYMKKIMQEGRLSIPYDTGLINEINVERFKLTKTGQMEFSHPDGTHDDRLWALALAVYASRPEIPHYKPAIAFGKVIQPFGSTRSVRKNRSTAHHTQATRESPLPPPAMDALSPRDQTENATTQNAPTDNKGDQLTRAFAGCEQFHSRA